METKNQPTQPVTPEETDLIAKAGKYKKHIIGVFVAVAVVLVAILVWYMVASNRTAKADEAIALADIEVNDSTALELYKNAATFGAKSGNRAKVEAAIRLYAKGEYEEALEYLDDASIDDKIVAAGVCTLEGDCYVNLEKNAEALKCYEKAISKADKNPQIVPLVLIKMANVYRAEKNFKAEANAYNTIINDYPRFTNTSNIDVKKYYERALAAAGE